MTDDDFERLYERASAALRIPAAGEGAARDRLIERIHAESLRSTTRRGIALLPWWAALAAAAIAFAVGLGTGRASSRSASMMAGAAASSDAQRPVEFVFVAPTARNVSLVGDFNGWDATATPMRRTDGRTTWSVAVQLPAGRHVYAFVVDGDAWVADPQAPLAPEQWYGQRNSVVIVASTGDKRL
jgi:predicted carbohydrate-binding protein with CBM48